MRERGDLDCLHEPFMYYYYVGLGKKILPHANLDIGRPTDFEDIVEDMLGRAEASAVFFKDMGYYVLPEIYEHPDLASRFTHLLLIRDPRKSILSYHKLDPDVSLEEIGLESQYHLYRWLLENGGSPLVIEAESVQRNPQAVMAAVWSQLGLDHKADAFQWQADESPEDWKSVSDWHQSVLASNSIRADLETEETISARFAEAAARTPRLQALLDHHWPFYARLKSRAHRFTSMS